MRCPNCTRSWSMEPVKANENNMMHCCMMCGFTIAREDGEVIATQTLTGNWVGVPSGHLVAGEKETL